VRDQEDAVIEAITFVVRPRERHSGLWTSFEYVQHIVGGLKHHGVPEDWVAHVLEVAVRTNTPAAEVAQAASEIRRLKTLK
jgi:hypothetical protein